MKWIVLDRFKLKVFGQKGKVLGKGIQEEHTAFLHNLLSNDIKGMKPYTLSYNLRLKQNGAPLQEFYVYKFQDYYVLDSEGNAQDTIEEFNKIKLSMRVYFEVLPYQHLFVFGEGSKEFISELFNQEINSMQVAQLQDAIVANNPIRLREEGYDIIAEDIGKFLEKLDKKDMVDASYMEYLRIQRCIPKIGKELREGFSPLEANIQTYAISLNKGCYVGQEAIARVHYRGRTPRTLALFSGDAPEGTKIRDEEKEVGIITSSFDSASMGYILRDRAQEGKIYLWAKGSVTLIKVCQ